MQIPDTAQAAKEVSIFEGFRPAPYLDVAGIPTIGYGTTHYPNGTAVSLSDKPITPTWGLSLLEHDLSHAAAYLWKALLRQPSMEQWSAMLSLAYNVGANAIANSTLVRYFNQGLIEQAADEFLKWDHGRVNGQLVQIHGLTTRRYAERALFLGTKI